MMVKKNLPKSSLIRVPRPMICLNSVIDLIVLVEHDELAGLRVDAGGHQLRGRGDDRVALVGVDEVVELGLALVVVAGDPHHVLAVLGARGRRSR